MFKNYPFTILLFSFALINLHASEIDPSAPISIRRTCSKPGDFFCNACFMALRMENAACRCKGPLPKGWYDLSCKYHHTQYLDWLENGSEESYMLSTMQLEKTKKPVENKRVNLRAKKRANQ